MSAHLLDLARSVLALEADAHDGAARALESTFRKLHDSMALLVGSGGYVALLRRAVHLTKPDHGWVARVVIASPFVLEGLEEQVAAVGEEGAVAGGAALMAQLLSLLCTFIGEPLTLRQVHQVWKGICPAGARATGLKETE